LIIESTATFKIDGESVIVGHSHPECAFNDSLISGFQNISESGESYFYTYIKCKRILADNSQIKNVFIEFGVNNILKEMDAWAWNDKTMNYRFPKFSPFMTSDEHLELLLNNFTGYLNALPINIKYQSDRLFRADFNYTNILGGHLPLPADDETLKDTNLLDNHVPKEYVASSTNILMLKKIILLCKDKNINYYLIRSPVMVKDKNSESEKLFEKIRADYFSEIEFLDFSGFSSDSSDFKDAGHLNTLGANKFSIWFNEYFISKFKYNQERPTEPELH